MSSPHSLLVSSPPSWRGCGLAEARAVTTCHRCLSPAHGVSLPIQPGSQLKVLDKWERGPRVPPMCQGG